MAHALYVFFSLSFIAFITLGVGVPVVLALGWLNENYPTETNTKPPHPPVEWL